MFSRREIYQEDDDVDDKSEDDAELRRNKHRHKIRWLFLRWCQIMGNHQSNSKFNQSYARHVIKSNR